MGIGGGIFLIAFGAILAFAVHADVGWIDIDVVGAVIMLSGVAVLSITVWFWRDRRRRAIRSMHRRGAHLPPAGAGPPAASAATAAHALTRPADLGLMSAICRYGGRDKSKIGGLDARPRWADRVARARRARPAGPPSPGATGVGSDSRVAPAAVPARRDLESPRPVRASTSPTL